MTLNNRILVVDDEADIRNGLSYSLKQMGFEVDTANSGEDAIHQLKNHSDLAYVITDYKMNGLSGFDVLKELKKISPQTPVVMMTGHGNVNHAVQAMQMGADNYLCKPFRFEELENILIKPRVVKSVEPQPSVVSKDENIVALLEKAKKAAMSSVPILVEGPSGAGKELLARQIHDWSTRAEKPWVAINCAALPAGLLESELFGFEKGSFTGAVERRSGKFEQAHTGTLLLDEIGELEPALQAKLLRVLQEGEIDRIGGKRPQKVDVRIIATTNRSLEDLVRKGQFREDLYFRLYGVRFILPALKDRPSDIERLSHEFLARQSATQGRHLEFAPGVMTFLLRQEWPGNVRELERAIERAAILCDAGTIHIENFELSANVARPKIQSFGVETDPDAEAKTIREMEKDIILRALVNHGGNRTHTAKALGMSLRTLRHKLKQYRDEGVEIEPSRQLQLGKIESRGE
ncbi:MAG: sigma-54-dependent Fis family transcriptional regulator [Deltaproteobacteria bacterium CG11_big_fil_rev_8_21_14_0_20_45_16]|nr:MAG: sigma-54-dependent Fis family transcriptional regulator [Deltaproteobacteria bacterium CG11_big_fil_rev_8_21_14_0_20_45_16]